MTILPRPFSGKAASGSSLLTAGLAAGTFLLLAAGSAQAQATFFANRAAFTASTTGTTTLDFEGIVPDNGFTSYPTPPGVTLSGVNFNINPAVANGILFTIGKDYYYPGTSVLSSQGSSTAVDDLLITFAAPVTAIGLDFGDNFHTQTFTFTLSDGETFTRLAGTGTNLNFVGLTTTASITSLDIQTAADRNRVNALNIDNFTFGQAAPAVPEASTTVSLGLLLALGLGGMVVAGKRKKTGVKTA